MPLSSTAHYVSAHPGSTFLIPIDRQAQVKPLLENNLKLSWNSFEIKQLADGGEEISFYFMDRTDDSHGSRYKASKDRVQLESYRYVSDRGGGAVILLRHGDIHGRPRPGAWLCHTRDLSAAKETIAGGLW